MYYLPHGKRQVEFSAQQPTYCGKSPDKDSNARGFEQKCHPFCECMYEGRPYYTQATAWAQAKMKLYTVLHGQCTQTMHFTSKVTLTVKSPSESELKLMRNVIKPVGQMDKNENSMDMTL